MAPSGDSESYAKENWSMCEQWSCLRTQKDSSSAAYSVAVMMRRYYDLALSHFSN